MAFIPYVPPSMAEDVNGLIAANIPNSTYDFLIYHHYHSKEAPVPCRALRAQLNFKSDINNADRTTEFYCPLGTELYKGDILYFPSLDIWAQVSWTVHAQVNALNTQIMLCNAWLQFQRYQDELTDENAMLLREAGWHALTGATPVSLANTYMRFDYGKRNETPGIIPSHLLEVKLQCNPSTQRLRINDQFDYGPERYKITNIEYADTDVNQAHGLLKIVGEKASGEVASSARTQAADL